VDEIDGLAPAIAIKQKNSTRNPRSTVATATEIYDYMRLLWARCGTVYCVHCDGLVKRDSVDEATEAVLALARERGSGLFRLFVPRLRRTPWPRQACQSSAKSAKTTVRSTKSAKAAKTAPRRGSARGEHQGASLRVAFAGFNRLWQHGTLFEFSAPESLIDLDLTLPSLYCLTASW